MINSLKSLLTVKCHYRLYEAARHKQRGQAHPCASSCFSHRKLAPSREMCTCRLHLSDTYRHQATKWKKKKKDMYTRLSLIYTSQIAKPTAVKVQREHKQWLVKPVQTSAQHLRENECITFFLLTTLVLSINLTKNIAVSTPSWQNRAWSNPVAWLCCWKSYSSTGGEDFALGASAKSYSSHSIPLYRPGNPSPVTRQGQDSASIVGIYI